MGGMSNERKMDPSYQVKGSLRFRSERHDKKRYKLIGESKDGSFRSFAYFTSTTGRESAETSIRMEYAMRKR